MSVPQRLLRNQRLRNLIPPRVKAAFAENRVRLVRTSRRSELRNVYHGCVHKTGSQWIRKVLADPEVYRVTGLRTYAYAPRLPDASKNRGYRGLRFEAPFPQHTIVSPLYIHFESFLAIPKPWGREPGQEDPASKLRKGIAGDWRNHFTPTVREVFADITSDLATRIGYPD